MCMYRLVWVAVVRMMKMCSLFWYLKFFALTWEGVSESSTSLNELPTLVALNSLVAKLLECSGCTELLILFL